MPSTILIIGGTGKVGSRIVPGLRARGVTPRVASRTGGDVSFDWHDHSTYGPALAGVSGVFIVGPGSATDWSPLLGTLLAEAAEAGVGHVVLLSARAVEFLPGGAVDRAERELRSGPVPWTILRPSHFAQNFTEAMFVPVDGTVSAPAGTGAEPFIDAGDIADVAVEVLASGSHRGETLELSGPTALTFEQAAAVLGDAHGRTLSYAPEDPEAHIGGLRAAQTPEGYIVWRMAMLDAIRRGDDAYLSDGVERVLGRPATAFDRWAATTMS